MRRDINFFSVYSSSYEGDMSDNFNKIAVVVIGGCFVLMLLIFSFLKIADLVVSSQANAQTSYLQSADTIKASGTLAKASAKLAALNMYKQAADATSSEFAVMPKISSKMLSDIAKMEPDDVNVSALSFTAETLTLTCTCKSSDSAAVFVHTLDNSSKFESVNYQGVTGSDTKGYDFSVIITLKEETQK